MVILLCRKGSKTEGPEIFKKVEESILKVY